MSPFDPTPIQSPLLRPAGPLASARYSPESNARDFTDSNGVPWTVREIIPEMRRSERRTMLTRPGYESGWLSFRSEEMSCRIAPFPASWRTISDYELERWCMKARAAARVRGKSSR
jgi:hypothetical protein